jgi:hypothetical protein
MLEGEVPLVCNVAALFEVFSRVKVEAPLRVKVGVVIALPAAAAWVTAPVVFVRVTLVVVFTPAMAKPLLSV